MLYLNALCSKREPSFFRDLRATRSLPLRVGKLCTRGKKGGGEERGIPVSNPSRRASRYLLALVYLCPRVETEVNERDSRVATLRTGFSGFQNK